MRCDTGIDRGDEPTPLDQWERYVSQTRVIQDLDINGRLRRSKGDPCSMRIELSGRKGKGFDAYWIDIVLDWIGIGIWSISLHERQYFELLMVPNIHPLFRVNMRDIHSRGCARIGRWGEPNLVGV